MPPIVRSVLTSPLTLAFGLVMLVGVGVVVGMVGYKIMDQKRIEKQELLKKAEEEAKALAAKSGPQKQLFKPNIENDPLKMAYIPLGEEMTINLGRSTHFVLVEVTIGTRFGARAEELIKTNIMSTRADIMAIISEYNFAQASKGTFKDELSLRIKNHLNEKFRTKIPVNIIVDEVLLTRYIAN